MPWKKFVTNWIEALTSNPLYHVTSVGRESETDMIVCKIETPAVPDKVGAVSLKFPDGQKLSKSPVWARYSQEQKATLMGFCSKSIGASCQAVDLLEKVPETRGSSRVKARLWVAFTSGASGGVMTLDLSLEGCRVEGDFRDLVGTETEFYLDLYDSIDPLKLKGQFVWSDGQSAGIRFLNLHVTDEIRLLRCLGRATTVPPSTFLPSFAAMSEPYTFRLRRTEPDRVSLHLCVTNWRLRIDFENAEIRGGDFGSFHRFHVSDSSSELTRLRAKHKINLEFSRQFIHLVLLDYNNDVVLDLAGEEIGFEREPKRAPPTEWTKEAV